MGGGYLIEYQKNFHRLLEILEIDVKRLQPIVHPVQFENIILPDESFAETFTNEYVEMINRLRDFALKNQQPNAGKKVYYFYGTAQFGEERLAEYFRSKGYEIISPEKLTTDEQLNALINCDSFASTLGSCSHNSVFLRDNAEAIFIPRAANRIPDYQQKFNQVHPINANYIDSSLSIFEKMNGPYCFIISEQLKKFFGEEFTGYTEDDFKVFLSYIRFCLERGYTLNQDALAYYEPVFKNFLEQLRQRDDLLKAYNITLD